MKDEEMTKLNNYLAELIKLQGELFNNGRGYMDVSTYVGENETLRTITANVTMRKAVNISQNMRAEVYSFDPQEKFDNTLTTIKNFINN